MLFKTAFQGLDKQQVNNLVGQFLSILNVVKEEITKLNTNTLTSDEKTRRRHLIKIRRYYESELNRAMYYLYELNEKRGGIN